MDRTDLGQGREENIKSGFKKIWESRAVDLRYLLDIHAERSSMQLDCWAELRREVFWGYSLMSHRHTDST